MAVTWIYHLGMKLSPWTVLKSGRITISVHKIQLQVATLRLYSLPKVESTSCRWCDYSADVLSYLSVFQHQ